MHKRRPVAQRNENFALIGSSYSPRSSNSDRVDVTKSEPDLLDTKYVEFRRPWYANPDYKGPRTTIISQNQLHSSKGSLSSKEDINNIPKIDFSYVPRQSPPHNNYGIQNHQQLSRRHHAKTSITESEPINNKSFFSFDNLLGDKIQNSQHMLKLSSSPESVFSAPNSSRASSERQSQLDINYSNRHPFSLSKNKAIKNKNQIDLHSVSPRHRTCNLEEVIEPKNLSETTMSWVDNNYKEHLTAQYSSQKLPRVLYKRKDRRTSNNGLDNRMIKTWQKRMSIYSDESDLTSVTDDDNSNSSVPSRNSYHRPEPHTNQANCEALFYVFTYLDTKSLARCSAVNRQWYNISREPILWKKIRITNSKITPNTFDLMNKWCTKVKEVSLQKLKTITKITQTKLKDAFDINTFEASLVRLLHLNKDTIKIIRIIDCDEIITGRILWSVSTHCKNLTKLVYLSKIYPLGQEDLYPLGRGCSEITSLIIPPGWPCLIPERFNDLCCEIISKFWTLLQILCIGGRVLTITGLEHIAKGCIKLQHLEIDHGPEITEAGASKMVAFGFRGLEKLDFTFTPVSPRAVVIFNNACPKLIHIGIHCNISDYFPDHSSSKSKADYKSLKTLFRRLKTRTGYSKVLDINFDYEPEP